MFGASGWWSCLRWRNKTKATFRFFCFWERRSLSSLTMCNLSAKHQLFSKWNNSIYVKVFSAKKDWFINRDNFSCQVGHFSPVLLSGEQLQNKEATSPQCCLANGNATSKYFFPSFFAHYSLWGHSMAFGSILSPLSPSPLLQDYCLLLSKFQKRQITMHYIPPHTYQSFFSLPVFSPSPGRVGTRTIQRWETKLRIKNIIQLRFLCVFIFGPAIWIRTFRFIESVLSTSWVLVSTQRFSQKTDTITTKICWRNQKVKVITRMCCIITRDFVGQIPMPHMGCLN